MSDTFEHNENTFIMRIEHDACHWAPWEEEDGHGPVSGWERRAKRPGEMILCGDGRGRLGTDDARRFYDFQAAVATARAEGWDAPPYGGTIGEKAHRAALADFDRLRRYCNGDWGYVGVIVSLADEDGEPLDDYSESLWDIESDAGDYLDAVARELADDIIEQFKAFAA